MNRDNSDRFCFYCGAPVLNRRAEMDHFPVPQECGGKSVVVSCVVCHDMKDRLTIDAMPIEFLSEIIGDFPKLSRATRIFLAKSLRVMQVTQHLKGKT